MSGNETQRQTEFLGVLGASEVDVSTLDQPVQDLCQDSSVHWTRRADGENILPYFILKDSDTLVYMISLTYAP